MGKRATLPCGGIIRIRFEGFFSPGEHRPGPPTCNADATGIMR